MSGAQKSVAELRREAQRWAGEPFCMHDKRRDPEIEMSLRDAIDALADAAEDLDRRVTELCETIREKERERDTWKAGFNQLDAVQRDLEKMERERDEARNTKAENNT